MSFGYVPSSFLFFLFPFFEASFSLFTFHPLSTFHFLPIVMTNHIDHRRYLDFLFLADAVVSYIFGLLAILTPHGIIRSLGGGEYNHGAHELFRSVIRNIFLFNCLHIDITHVLARFLRQTTKIVWMSACGSRLDYIQRAVSR